MTDDSAAPSTLVALVLPTLVPAQPLAFTVRERRIVEVARQLQLSGASPDAKAVSVAVNLGFEWVDPVAEILGRVGSAGEQLGLALASNKDARRWTEPGALDAIGWDPPYATMGVRAQAEMTALWTLGAAHGLANALVRLLRLNESSRHVIDAEFPKARGFPPFSEQQAAWVSFEPGVLRSARRAAAQAPSPAIIAAATALSDVLGNQRWTALLDLRNVGFHRWRPQSVDGGTPKATSLIDSPSGRSLTVGLGASNAAPDAEEVLAAAECGLDLFCEAAMTFDQHLHAAINELGGKALFKVEDHP